MRFMPVSHRLRNRISSVSWRSWKTWVVIAITILVAFAIGRAFSGTEDAVSTNQGPRQVEVKSVSDLMNGGQSLSTVAEIQSVNEAVIRSESGGRVTRVNVALGDRVGAGSVLVEVENSSQRAVVLQAEGSLDAAKAALAKIEGGTRDEQLAILRSSLSAERERTVTTLLGAYNATDSAIRDTADQLFTGIELRQIQFTILTSNQQLEQDIESQRRAITSVLTRQDARSRSLSVGNDVKAELALTEEEVRSARVLLDSILKALADAIPNDNATADDIAAYKAAATAARATLTSTLTSLASSKSTLEIAEKNLEQGITGAQTEDVAGARAALKQAQGVYNAALANLEKTIIRSPIAGSLNNFSVKLGDVLSPSQQIGIVSNNGALEVVAYVSDEDRAAIQTGARVRVDGRFDATVTRVAPAIDPVTRRAEIKIGLPSEAIGTLANGQSVRIVIERSHSGESPTEGSPIVLPITALKLEADRTVVFTIGEGDRLVAIPVAVGPLTGSKIEILSGLTADQEIVADARGLKEGDTVAPLR